MVTKTEFYDFVNITSKLKNQKIESSVVDALWDKLQNEKHFIFQDYEYSCDMLVNSEQERISFASLMKYLCEAYSKRREKDNYISHAEAYKFLNDTQTKVIAKDCMKLIKQIFPIATINRDEYILEMEQLHRKYPGDGFDKNIIKLKNRLKGMIEVVDPKTKEIYYQGNYNNPDYFLKFQK